MIPVAVGGRTVVRLFLVVGGLVFLVLGAVEGSWFEVSLGGVAMVVGAVGLWRERATTSSIVAE